MHSGSDATAAGQQTLPGLPPRYGRAHAAARSVSLHRSASRPDNCSRELTPSPMRMWQNPICCGSGGQATRGTRAGTRQPGPGLTPPSSPTALASSNSQRNQFKA